MANTLVYAIIFVVLFVFATVQVLIEELGLLDVEGTMNVAGLALSSWEVYLGGVTIIMVLSFVKAGFVAGWYQHLKYEPRSLTYLILTGLAAAVALTVAAAYSIT